MTQSVFAVRNPKENIHEQACIHTRHRRSLRLEHCGVRSNLYHYTTSTSQRVQPMQSQTHATKHVKKRHHARHYASHKGKKLAVKHTPATKTVKTNATS